MAVRGDIIRNNVSGDTIEFLETSSMTGGRFTRIRFTVKPGGFRPVEHIHPEFDEHFRVLSGKLAYTLGGDAGTVESGGEITLPREIPHTHFNNCNEDLIMEQTFSPSLDVEIFLENLFGLSCDGRVKNGEPELLQVLVWLRKLDAKTYLAKLPVRLQDALAVLLFPLASLLGYKASYRKYSEIEF